MMVRTSKLRSKLRDFASAVPARRDALSLIGHARSDSVKPKKYTAGGMRYQ